MKKPKLAIVLLFSIGIVCKLLGQPDYPRKQLWYQNPENDKKNRYEGLYSKDVSNRALETVAFYSIFEPYEYGKSQKLTVKFYLPEGDLNTPYFLKGEELIPLQFYWMEDKRRIAKPGWNYFSDWPVDALLSKYRIPRNNLGILVKIGNPNDSFESFAPCYIYNSNLDINPTYYIAKFRLGYSISESNYKIFQGHQNQINPKTAKAIKTGQIQRHSGGDVLTIAIPISDLGSSESWYTLYINLTKKGSASGPIKIISFYHQPIEK